MDNNISRYDFKQSQKFSKEQLTILSIFSQKFINNASLYLNETLNKKFNINFDDIDQISFNEYMTRFNDEENMDILVEFELIPKNTSTDYVKNLLFRIERKLILSLIDLMLGGKGEVKDVKRKLTSIDNKLMNHLISDLISKMDFQSEDYTLKISNMYLNPTIYQNLHPSLFVATMEFNVLQNEVLGKFEFCLPYKKFQPIIDRISTKELLQESDLKVDTIFSSKLSEKIKDVNLTVTVEVGDKHIQLGDLLNLTKGTVLKLNKKIREPLDVYVEDVKTFESIPGLIGDRKGVSIIDNVKKGDRKYD